MKAYILGFAITLVLVGGFVAASIVTPLFAPAALADNSN
jgi:hypothetical protein